MRWFCVLALRSSPFLPMFTNASPVHKHACSLHVALVWIMNDVNSPCKVSSIMLFEWSILHKSNGSSDVKISTVNRDCKRELITVWTDLRFPCVFGSIPGLSLKVKAWRSLQCVYLFNFIEHVSKWFHMLWKFNNGLLLSKIIPVYQIMLFVFQERKSVVSIQVCIKHCVVSDFKKIQGSSWLCQITNYISYVKRHLIINDC